VGRPELAGTQVSFERDFTLTARDKDGGQVNVHIEPNTAKVSVTLFARSGR
jgi:YbbR domain-containing protein